jgi:hypothetical protein
MGAINIKINSKTRYVILYGEQGVGKTLMQYCLQSNFNDFSDIRSTKGCNYEEIDLKGTTLGIFDCSGDQMQYEIVDIISKCAEVDGIIFMVSLDNIDELDRAKDKLKTILNNKNIKLGVSLLIIFNYRSSVSEKFWFTEKHLVERMSLEKYKEEYGIKYAKAIMCDVNVNSNTNGPLLAEFENFNQSMEK